jgi:hypothetical protein
MFHRQMGAALIEEEVVENKIRLLESCLGITEFK